MFNAQYVDIVAVPVIEGVTPDAMKLLCRQAGAGNVRQLRNVVEAAYLLADGPQIGEQDLSNLESNRAVGRSLECAARNRTVPAERVSPERERHELLDALEATRWNKSKAAGLLQWARMTLDRKIAKYELIQ
jgi:DNA-binding NtrC family response regulator